MLTSLFSFSLLLPFPAAASQPGWRNCGACSPHGHRPGRGRMVSPLLRAGRRQVLPLVYNACQVLPHGSGFCKFICLPQVFSSHLLPFLHLPKQYAGYAGTKETKAQSRHPEEHPEVGRDCTVGEDVVLAAALGLIAHQPWHQGQGSRAWFVVTAGYGRVHPQCLQSWDVSVLLFLCLLGFRWHLHRDIKSTMAGKWMG